MTKKIVRMTVSALIFCLLTFLDQWSKRLAVENLMGRGPFVIWDRVFELLYSENRGAAFGMMQGGGPFFAAVAVLVFCAVVYLLWRLPGTFRHIPMALCAIAIAAGAAGNLIDRIVNGYVVDFLYFKLIDFPIFNVADCYVTVSAAVMCFLMISGFYHDEDLEFLRPGRRDLQ